MFPITLNYVPPTTSGRESVAFLLPERSCFESVFLVCLSVCQQNYSETTAPPNVEKGCSTGQGRPPSNVKVDPNEKEGYSSFFSLIVGSGTRVQVAVALSSLARENSGGRVC